MATFDDVLIVCTGTVLDISSKKHTAFQLIDDAENKVGNTAYFIKLKTTFVTGIFKVQGKVVDGNLETIQPSTMQYVRQIKDKEWAAEIRIAHEAAETAYSALQQWKKARNDKSDILDVLKPLRRAWHNTNATGKLALEVRVLNYLRNGKDL